LVVGVSLGQGCSAPLPPSAPDALHADLYYLPFEHGRASLVLQGHFGPFSHQRSYALDFELPRGTPVLAARHGVVTAIRDDCPDCSCVWDDACPCCGFANRVEITHADGTRAIYAHLQPAGVLVRLRDAVDAGHAIALSGSTGRSFMPHLHFEVRSDVAERATGRLGPSNDGTMEVRFEDASGDGVPRMWHVYRGGAANTVR